MVTISEIAAFEAEKNRIESELAAMAREIYEIRNGHDIDTVVYASGKSFQRSYAFESFDRYGGEISVSFYHSDQCGGDTRTVSFPENYLSVMNWRQIEADNRRAKEAAGAVGKFAQALRRSINGQARQRRDYDRLRAKFETV